MPKYKLFDHTADIGVEIFGRTKKVLFANAACALFDILIQTTDNKSKIGKGTKGQQKIRTVAGTDMADLLVNFLRELLYLFNGEALIVEDCHIQECSNQRLVAKLLVEPYSKEKYSTKMELKAVTYHGLSVERIKNGWRARVIFDV